MIENTILNANRTGRKALVFSMTYQDLWAVEAAAQVGFDAVALDGEHGAFSPADVDDIVRVANGYGLSVMARVQNIQPNTLNLWLDRGIQGVVGPHIESQEEAQQLADACLFPPDGWRSWGGGRGTEFNDTHVLNEKSHIPPDLVVACVIAYRKPPEVRIWTLRNQSRVGNRPPTTSTPHWPACFARR